MIKLEHRNKPTDDRSTLNGHKITLSLSSSSAAAASSKVVDDWTADYAVIVRRQRMAPKAETRSESKPRPVDFHAHGLC
jgi:hypothetical protein